MKLDTLLENLDQTALHLSKQIQQVLWDEEDYSKLPELATLFRSSIHPNQQSIKVASECDQLVKYIMNAYVDGDRQKADNLESQLEQRLSMYQRIWDSFLQ